LLIHLTLRREREEKKEKSGERNREGEHMGEEDEERRGKEMQQTDTLDVSRCLHGS